MALLAYLVCVGLALWTLAGIVHALPGHRWRITARWMRPFRPTTSWRVFSTDDQTEHSGVPELHYRDRTGKGEPPPWIVVADACWAWHSGLWMPERRLVNCVYYLIRELAAEPAAGTRPPSAHRLAAFLRRRDPPAPGAIREFRLVVRDRAGSASLETLCTFWDGPDGLHG